MLACNLFAPDPSTMSDSESYFGYSSVESNISSSDDDHIHYIYAKNKRFKTMSNIDAALSSESDNSCSSQFESTSEDEEEDDDDFVQKPVRRSAQVPFDVYRYTPTMKMADIRDMGRKYYLQNQAIIWSNGLCVNKNFCLCTSSGVDRARLHMTKTFNHFRNALSLRRFLLVVFSFIYLLTLRHKYELPQYTRRHKYICERCTMLKWWLKGYNDDLPEMIMFLYVNYVAPQQFRRTYNVNSIERYLLKKYTTTYIPCYIKTTSKYINKDTAKKFVNKIVYILYHYGEQMSKSSFEYHQNQLVQLCVMCHKYKEFNRVLDIIDASLSFNKKQPNSLYAITYFKVLRLGWFDVYKVLKNLRINFVYNPDVAHMLFEYFYNDK